MANIQIGIDLGSANTLIYLKGKGIILTSPTVIAVESASGKDVAIGSAAKKMLGKVPDFIKASRPVREGIITDMDDATLLLTRLLEKTELVSFVNHPEAFVAVPVKSTEVERRALQSAVYESGTKNVTLVQRPLAAAVGAGLKVLGAKGCMIVDIGEGTTESAVISHGEVVVSRSQNVAGNYIDRAVSDYFKNERKIEIGELGAERLKVKLASATPLINRGDAPVIGRNLKNGAIIASSATGREISYAIRPALAAIASQIRATLEATPPELMSDVYSRGIVLTGGGALIPGITDYLSSELSIPAAIAVKPTESVCLGIGKMLESEGELNKLLYK